MKTRIVAVALVALVAVVGLAVLSTWRLAAAWGPDVNGDGQVRVHDILAVVQAFGQAVPTEVPSREQNVDANGYLKVHEQGVASVNLASQSQALDVNVLSEPSPTPVEYIYTLAQNQQTPFLSNTVNTEGCRKIEVFVDTAASNIDALTQFIVYESTDGVNLFPLFVADPPTGVTSLNNEKFSWSSTTIAKWIAVELKGGGNTVEQMVLHCVSE